MTPSGTFVINGAERIVVSQLHRSPGVFSVSLTMLMERNSTLQELFRLRAHGLNLLLILTV